MEISQVIKLLIPLLGVVLGFYVKGSKDENFTTVKKYWLILVVISFFVFLFRLFKFLAI